MLTEPETLDHLLAQVSRLHHHRAHAMFGQLKLYRGQPPVLFALWERDGQTSGELARRLDVTAATMTRMLQRMERSGFVARRPDEVDQRVSRVYLTPAGRAVRSKLEAFWQRMDVEVFAGLSERERATLRKLLLRVRANLATAIAEPPPPGRPRPRGNPR
ncbi:MAG TPA: MarR family transcriptional regulator [Anaerolineales bacterium]|nr:MarR family transcriptional regulator [Anaerolineales bacterium]HRF49967.1 MarR family transcriptional regulator [Anaerolineales bacterium]